MFKNRFIGVLAIALLLVVGKGYANDAQSTKDPISIATQDMIEASSNGDYLLIASNESPLLAYANTNSSGELLAQVNQKDTADEFESFEDGLTQTQDHIQSFPEKGSNWSDYLQWISYFLVLFLLWRTWLMKNVLRKNKLE